MTVVEIKSCPSVICSSKAAPRLLRLPLKGVVWLRCPGCGASGPDAPSAEDAIATWNDRPTDAEVGRLRRLVVLEVLPMLTHAGQVGTLPTQPYPDTLWLALKGCQRMALKLRKFLESTISGQGENSDG